MKGVIDGYNLRRRQEKKQKTSARGLNPGQGFNSPIQEENRNRDDSDIFTGESKCLQQMFRSMILANKEIEPDIEQSLCYPSMTSDGKDQKHPPNCIVTKTKQIEKSWGLKSLNALCMFIHLKLGSTYQNKHQSIISGLVFLNSYF